MNLKFHNYFTAKLTMDSEMRVDSRDMVQHSIQGTRQVMAQHVQEQKVVALDVEEMAA